MGIQDQSKPHLPQKSLKSFDDKAEFQPPLLDKEKKETFQTQERQPSPRESAKNFPLPPVLPSQTPIEDIREKKHGTSLHKEIDHILNEDMEEVCLSMTDEQRRDFITKEEEIASTIEQLIETAKITVKRVIFLIRHWMKMIPRVNSFFLEQAAKIKTDRIMVLIGKSQKSDWLDQS